MHKSYLYVAYLLAVLNGTHGTANTNDQVPILESNTTKTAEAADEAYMDQLNTVESVDKIYWSLDAWINEEDCTGNYKHWSDWIYHQCENGFFSSVTFDPTTKGLYRLCVYAHEECKGEEYTTSEAVNCAGLEGPWWGSSWRVIKAAETC